MMKAKTAIKLAIDALGLQQKQHSAGHYEFLRSGNLFDWAIRDHKKWTRLQSAREALRQMLHDGRQMDMFAAQDQKESG